MNLKVNYLYIATLLLLLISNSFCLDYISPSATPSNKTSDASYYLIVLDDKGIEHKLSDWSILTGIVNDLIDKVPEVREYLHVDALSQDIDLKMTEDAKSVGNNYPRPFTVMELIPFANIVSLTPEITEDKRRAIIILKSTQKERVTLWRLNVTGTEDLGELGKSKYTADERKIKEIRFPTRKADITTALSSSRPGDIMDRASRIHHADNIYNLKTSDYFGELSPTFYFQRDGNTIELDRDKLRSITFQAFDNVTHRWQVTVELNSGNSYKLEMIPYGTIVAVLKDRWIVFNYNAIKSIIFTASDKSGEK